MSATQERTMKQFSKQIGSSTYKFRRKGNEHQFNFNSGIEDAIDTAKLKLVKADSKTTNPKAKEAQKRAESSLYQSFSHQAKTADCSNLSW